MKCRPMLNALFAGFVACAPLAAQDSPVEPLFEQNVSESNGLRVAQYLELDKYIREESTSRGRIEAVFKPRFDSLDSYVESLDVYRDAFQNSIGYPPPQFSNSVEASLELIGEDTLGNYYRLSLPVAGEVRVEGIYIVPKSLSGKVPLIISMHGGGGSPEVALFHGGANYHDMVRGGVKAGYAVFAPQHLFSVEGQPQDIRRSTDTRLRMIGTSITAIEIAKIVRSIDYLSTRPEIDADRIGMVGLSYGGYYTLVTMAVEPRIRVGVSSCYFGCQEGRYVRDELSVPSDFQFNNRFTMFRDEDLVSLICPRPLLIQAGENDGVDHREPGKAVAEKAEEPYRLLKVPERFSHLVFAGGHEFHDESAWEFIKAHL